MRRRNYAKFGCLLLCLALVGCQSNSQKATTNTENSEEETTTQVQTLNIAKEVTQITGDYSEKEIKAEWSMEDATKLSFEKETITIDGAGATQDGTVVTITEPGTYVLSGTLEDGQVIVDLTSDDNVQLVLNGVNLSSSTQAPIVVLSAKNTYLTLADGTENKVSDAGEYVYEDETVTEPDAAIFSKDDLIINGTGSLTVEANFNDGIKSKDDLKIIDGTIMVTAAGDGIAGKDSVSIRSGAITIDAKKDGIKSSQDADESKGYIVIDGGTFHITAGNDGIQACTFLCINDGTFDIETNGGSANASYTAQDTFNPGWGGDKGGGKGGGMRDGVEPPDRGNFENNTDGTAESNMQPPSKDMPSNTNTSNESSAQDVENKEGTELPEKTGQETAQEAAQEPAQETTQETESSSAKALKSDYNIGIYGGSFTIDSSDDSIHSNQSVMIQDGNIELSSGDDGVHSDTYLEINGGTITITKSYEGLESQDITINGGQIDLVAMDDGVNVSGGSDGSSESGRPGQNTFSSTEAGTLTINGGTLTVDATGDGLDANGAIVMTDGNVTVYGPTNDGNGVLDYDSTFDISGGVLIGAGSAGMAQVPSDSSSQASIAYGFDETLTTGTEVTVTNASGDELYAFTITKESKMILISGPDIVAGENYTIVAGSQSVTIAGGETQNLQTGGMKGGR